MGRMKESVPDYVYDGIMSYERYGLKEDIKDYIATGIYEDKTLLREFLEDVTPMEGPDYFLYVQEDKSNYINMCFDRARYIEALCCLTQHPVTLYYHPASFAGWITNDHVKAVRCLYVDIDDIGMQADKTTREKAVNFLKKKYNLTDEQMPEWCVLSGNGMHLVYLIDEITPAEEKLREKYTLSLITHFRGDFAGLVVSHQFRCPESFNLKDEPIKGKLFRLNKSENKDITRLNWCLKTDEAIKTYKKTYYDRRTEKQKATAAKNKALEKEFLKKLGDIPLREYLERTNISDQDRKIAKKLYKIQLRKEEILRREKEVNEIKGRILNYSEAEYDLYVYCENTLPYLHLRFFDGYKPQNRTWNLILDLHNFFIRHKGCLVSRDIFFYILASLFKLKKEPKGKCINWCKKYVDYSYYNEMRQIIDLVYKSKTKYHFTYVHIASSLCFTEKDIELSYCNFSEERQIEAKKKRNQRAYQNKLKKDGKVSKKEYNAIILNVLKEHPEIDEVMAKEYLDIGRTTYYTMRRKIRESAVD